MPSTKSYETLHKKVVERPGALERLAALREETLGEIGLYDLRRELKKSQADLGAQLGISQSAVSQIERGDVKLSTLSAFVEALGARLVLSAVFDTTDDDEPEISIPIRVA